MSLIISFNSQEDGNLLPFLQYIRLDDIAYKKVINALTNKDLLTVDHLRKIVPGINVNRLQVATR